ncbi:threonylcarbamoyladenosine tRNA methylthiotransferase [Chelonus insularis]|uniref:threonylcarbamoyladenosine tRNA methylthiotransferase n=1 Tax=Chelonus insularis TaxID=460826 RepID=UPI00158D5FB1|nr:threonylcarbamoyladenosine tRNA methylthiotransferase [Chelonus insularis]
MIASTICQEDTIDDIEDLTTLFEQPKNPKMKETNGPKVIIRQLQNTKHLNEEEENAKDTDTESLSNLPSSIVPGCATIYVKTWGCTHNSSDSEYMAGQLASYGYKITDDKLKADLWLLNSCTVKAPAEDHFRNEIKAGKELNKYIVLAGCVPQAAPNSEFIEGFSVIGVQQIDRVVEVVEETLKGNSVRFLGQKKENGRKMGGASLSLPKIRRNPLIEIIAINTGCLNQCTYCKTKHARGKLGSYSLEEIVDRAELAFYEGVCELWLTSEDTGAYGLDIGTNLPELLWQIIQVIPNNCRMRIGMTNPPYILEHLEEICKILNHPKVYSFLHIPVQSGSDQVLIDMKREYTRAEFEKVVDFIKERVPGVTIATDIICGFPTETEQDFEETMDLCKKYKFPSLFINQFFPRPGTPAAKMVKIPTQLVKQRTKRLSEFFQSYEPYAHKIGEIQRVLVTEISHDQKYYVGHNKFYEQVLVPMKKEYMGKMIAVKITETSKYSMKGEPVILIIYWCRFIDKLKIILSIFNLNNLLTLIIIILFAIFVQLSM